MANRPSRARRALGIINAALFDPRLMIVTVGAQYAYQSEPDRALELGISLTVATALIVAKNLWDYHRVGATVNEEGWLQVFGTPFAWKADAWADAYGQREQYEWAKERYRNSF